MRFGSACCASLTESGTKARHPGLVIAMIVAVGCDDAEDNPGARRQGVARDGIGALVSYCTVALAPAYLHVPTCCPPWVVMPMGAAMRAGDGVVVVVVVR